MYRELRGGGQRDGGGGVKAVGVRLRGVCMWESVCV